MSLLFIYCLLLLVLTVVAVEQEDDPVIKGIYERLAESESEPVVNSSITFGPLTLLVRQEWMDLKNLILTERPDKHHKTIFLRGTSGRGKSSFVYYLMYCILIAAKRSKKRKAEQESIPLIGFVTNKRNDMIVSQLLTPSGVKAVTSIPTSVYYYISDIKGDENRTNLAQRFTMVVASDDAGKTEFRKRIKEAGKDSNSGYTYAMTSPTRDQMHSMFEKILTADEIDFRLDVVGCNPRDLGMNPDPYKRNAELERLVGETCEEVLGCTSSDADPSHYNWVMGVVMQSIDSATINESKIAVNSLFREDVFEGNRLISVFTSTFMCFLAGKIRDKFKTDTMGFLTMIFGRCGVGNCHEYDAHNFFCGLAAATHPCWSWRTKRWEEVPLGGGPRTKVIFRNIKGISGALDKSASIPQRYLLPSITNLALIDSIIPPNVVLQMTISETYRGAASKAVDISKQLNNPQPLLMIFVVPEEVVAKFKFPTDLPNVDMYVTVAKPVTLADAQTMK